MKNPMALFLLFIPIFLFIFELRRLKKKTNFFYTISFYREKNRAALVFRIKQLYLISLYTMGMIFLIIAFSNPYIISEKRDVLPSNPFFTTDTIFLFDISQSMLADDGDNLSRLEKGKKAAISLVAAEDGRFGVVVFKGEPFTILPLAGSKSSAINTIAGLSPDLYSATGTDIGRGLLRAVESFPVDENTDKKLYLFTDGEEPARGSFPRLKNIIEETMIKNNIFLYITPPDNKSGSPVPDRDVISVPDMRMINTLGNLPNSSVISIADFSLNTPFSSLHRDSAEYSFSLFFSLIGIILFIVALLLRGAKWQDII